jgi:NAD(P)-dependent dehydrogenase (short-subunit alcohol dehydrogenase family)
VRSENRKGDQERIIGASGSRFAALKAMMTEHAEDFYAALWTDLRRNRIDAARRVGQPQDIANAVLFLATTPFATGSTVRVDGGKAIAGHALGSHPIARSDHDQ